MSSRAAIGRRRRLIDIGARYVVTAGGLGVIAGVLGILAFILIEVWPLTQPARVTPVSDVPAGVDMTATGVNRKPAPAAILVDEYRSHVILAYPDSRLRVYRDDREQTVMDRPLLAGNTADPGAAVPLHRVRALPAVPAFAASTRDGRVAVAPVRWKISFHDDVREVAPEFPEPLVLALDPAGQPLDAFAAQPGENGTLTAAGRLAGGALAVARREVKRNPFSGKSTESVSRHETACPAVLLDLAMDRAGENLYGVTAGGDVLWWRLNADGPVEADRVTAGPSPAVALALLLGDRTLVTGHADGSLRAWFPTREEEGILRLRTVRDFPAHPGPARLIVPSPRDKGFLVQDDGGVLGLYYSTSHRTLWRGPSPLPDATALAYAPKADGAALAGPGRSARIDISNPHPETTPATLFAPVWYEGYTRPEYAWQSTGGTDDFEIKLSLTPLLFGTFKGAIYSLVIAIPLGIFGAMYASHFMHHNVRRFVKPAVEIMAAMPSVVLGFVAGLWLAPLVERFVPALLLMIPALPVAAWTAGFLWDRLPARVRGRTPEGVEIVPTALALAAALGLCMALNAPAEAAVFDGSFPRWVERALGFRYDQRNAVVVGLAMGFAVIPIIFSIAEEAFTNVPRSLVSASLALGATRWQTVTRVVFPTASPGLFSAVMVGFGRAVGETMIVLMAAGNTPIMDWSLFNGFRTLSANIAVEIPEAPHGGTLYRTLFLAALLLYAVTFAVNTAAEIVRQRLRRRYSRL
jgi:phosphate transport system permease protein